VRGDDTKGISAGKGQKMDLKKHENFFKLFRGLYM
jgi:hypothetical protein